MGSWDELFVSAAKVPGDGRGGKQGDELADDATISTYSRAANRTRLGGAKEVGALREMVGVVELQMPGVDVERQSEALGALLGDRPSSVRATGQHPVSSVSDLSEFVAANTFAPTAALRAHSAGGSDARAKGRRQLRWDPLNIVAAVVAALALLFTMVLGGAAWASQSPLSESLDLLASDEARLADSRDLAAQTRLALSNDLTELQAEIAAFEAARIGAGDSVDAAASKKLADVTAVRVLALDEFELAQVPAPYHRSFDVSTERGIAQAQNAVAESQLLVDQSAKALEQQQLWLVSQRKEYLADVAAFAKTIPARAETIVGENPDASDAERAAVTAAAQAILTEQAGDKTGAVALARYSQSVVALRAANEEGRIAREAAEQAERDAINNNTWWDPSWGSGGDNTQVTPNPPVVPNPPTTPSPSVTPPPQPPVDPEPPVPGGGEGGETPTVPEG